jgi:hypothetical protein
MRILLLLILFYAISSAAPKGFILMKGNTFLSGDIKKGNNRIKMRVEDYEIMDHTVTNREYRKFIKATRYTPPLHWKKGRIPRGKEDFPVIFVNKFDIKDYTNWLTQKEGRIYRLPTTAEFEYAARGGLKDKIYVWGNGDPKGRVNYNEKGDRSFNGWQAHLKPAKWGAKNGFGLYGMAGNVWQIVESFKDPSLYSYKYRIDDPTLVESLVMGGSWSKGKLYLRCGHIGFQYAGIRHPDLGFRLVREPKKGTWTTVNRRVSGLSLENGTIFLSWELLPGDTKDTRFKVYRSKLRRHAGFRITDEPVSGRTCIIDKKRNRDHLYQYYVRPVHPKGEEGHRSEWYGVRARQKGSSVLVRFTPGGLNNTTPMQKQSLVPIFGDLNGDGTLGCVMRLSNGVRETSQDPGLPVQLEAFTSYGRSLWRKDVCFHDRCYGNSSNVPFNVWDMDGDGRDEVITRLQIGNSVYLAVLDGLTGTVKRKTLWPKMATDTQRSSSRIHMAIAYLDGKQPSIITQTGLYENAIIKAYGRHLKPLWQHNQFGGTNGSAGHKIEVKDIDNDGKHEIFIGPNCLNSDGTLRWSAYLQHADAVNIHDFLPERKGLEAFILIETDLHAGAYMVDAKTGSLIWKTNREDDPVWSHGHRYFTENIWTASKGIECIFNRMGHGDGNLLLYTANGKRVMENFPSDAIPIEWDGDADRELITGDAKTLNEFNGEKLNPIKGFNLHFNERGRILMTADLCGDFRDEIVVTTKPEKARPSIIVLGAGTLIDKRYLAQPSDLEYQLWLARNMGGGYGRRFNINLKLP